MLENMTHFCSCSPGTAELLLSLTGAFLLGCLLCSLIRQLRQLNHDQSGPDDPHALFGHTAQLADSKAGSAPSPASPKSQGQETTPTQTYTGQRPVVKLVEDSVQDASNYSTPRIDDLKRISSIDNNLVKLLKEHGIRSFTDLRDVKTELLYKLLDHPKFNVRRQEVETWPHQARLAAKGDWKKLEDYQHFMARSREAIKASRQFQTRSAEQSLSEETAAPSHEQSQPLTRLSAIESQHEEQLQKLGISRFADLITTDDAVLKAALGEETDLNSLRHEAELANTGAWEKLEEYQDFQLLRPRTAKNNPDNKAGNGAENTNEPDFFIKASIDPTIANQAQSHVDMESSEFPPSSTTSPSNTLSNNDSSKDSVTDGNVASLLEIDLDEEDNQTEQGDDLTRIEGITEPIADILRQNGIDSFEQLSQTHRNTLKTYLETAGNRYRLHEPETWPHQAGMACRGEWQRLKEYQEFMLGKRDADTSTTTVSISESHTTASERHSNPYVDDLTKIEGIGPKIEQLLNDAGILNFAQLKQTDRDTLKKILDQGGPQFKMHEPQSWPQQAALADNGDWQALDALQDKLTGGT